MKTEKSVLIKICILLYVVVLILFGGRIVFRTDLHKFFSNIKGVTSNDYSVDWTLDSGESVGLKDITAGNQGGSYVVTKVLPEKMLETDSIYLSTSNLSFDLYVENDLIYSYETRENLTGNGDGVSYHMIGLGVKDSGKTVRIEARAVLPNGHGGRINEVYFGPEEQFRYYLQGHNYVAESLSVLMVIIGLTVMIIFLMLFRTTKMLRSLWALGLSAVLFGLWSLSDTGMPQLLTGAIYACREIVYALPSLCVFPMIYFINSFTKLNRKIYLYLAFLVSVLSFAWLLISRYYFDANLRMMSGAVYFPYIAALVMMIGLLVENEMDCRKKNVSSGLRSFYIGVAALIATSVIDIIKYTTGAKVSIGRGTWFRFGLVLFFLFMTNQIFAWWAAEKISLERDRFINRLLQYATDMDDPGSRLNKMLEYLCTELNADRAYIFEDNLDGTFDNTYEYCKNGVTPEIDNLKGLPYKGLLDAWYNEYKKGGHIMIYDMEAYRSVNEELYRILKPQGIRTLVTGPLMLEGTYIGFFGVDNPPPERMKEIPEIMKLLMYFMSESIAQRDHQKQLMDYSFHDAMTGVGNRRAIRVFEDEELDTSRSYGIIMCDLNGLKNVNDTRGHEAGDELIKTAVACLAKVFGTQNVFRMGGDEFAVYAYEESKEGFERLIVKLNSALSEKGVRMAIGYSFAEGGDPDYKDRMLEADNRMYEEKRKFYSEGNDRRK